MREETVKLNALQLAPRPATLADTGLSQLFLADLVSKHLLVAGVLDLMVVARRLALPGSIVEEIIGFLRTEGRAELRASRDNSPVLRFGLTERGRALANDALQRDGYVGPAPVTLVDYERVVHAQSVGSASLSRAEVHAAFADTVIDPGLLDRLGPAVHSGRAVFVYGPAGTGKTFIARRLSRLLGPPVLLPHAVIVGDSVVGYFDPNVHRRVELPETGASALLSAGHDARFVLCERPVVACGGELTLDRLELQYEVSTRRYSAPLQMRANTGLLLIDDLGRQRVDPVDLFNRWIVPLEERRDQLSLNTGLHFSVPFDLVLIFSTNLDPKELADEAFLRRIGYKIRFTPASREAYLAIWSQVCRLNDVQCDPRLAAYLVDQLYPRDDKPLLPCHPRDLLGLALDYMRYSGTGTITEQALEWAWRNYFVEV